MQMKLFLGAALLAAPITAATAQQAAPTPKIKNIIVLINDGGGPTVYDAYRMYKGKALVTDTHKFKEMYVSTYPLREDSGTNNTPGSPDQDPAAVYKSASFWNTAGLVGQSNVPGYSAYPAAFSGYEWSREFHPDSGETASTLANGHKTYNNAINVDGAGVQQVSFIDLINAARKAGKRAGVVTTVEFADATPAALGGAHNVSRYNHTDISNEMFGTGNLDVIGGCGNPDYDDDGQARDPSAANYSWISQALWNDLKAGTNTTTYNQYNFQLVQNKSDIEDLASGASATPEKLAMIQKCFTSTQFNRSGDTINPQDPHTKEPFTDPLNSDVASQANLTLAALNALGRTVNKSGNTKGFYLMTEAGAVDRAEHANNLGRMIEEMQDSDNTVQAVIDWVNRADTDANWGNTLLIVTADHDHLLYGPDGARIPFEGLKPQGAGKMPLARFFGPNHGTGLVPFYVYGAGSDALLALATKSDSYTDAQGRTYGHGAYADQSDVGKFLKSVIAASKD